MKKIYRAHNPSHPGALIRTFYLRPLKLTVSEFSRHIGFSRKTASAIINGKASITPRTAARLSRIFSTSVEFWLNLQRSWDLYQLSRDKKEERKRKALKIIRHSRQKSTEK